VYNKEQKTMKKFIPLAAAILASTVLSVPTPALSNEIETTTSEITFIQGDLEIGGPNGLAAPQINFGSHLITSGERNYIGTPSSPLTVTDNRGTEAGWTITVNQLTDFYYDKDFATTLAGSEIRIGNIAGTASITGSNLILSPSEGVQTVATALPGTGSGVTNFDLENVVLNIPAGVTTLEGSYEAVLVWTVADIPTP
jgi:hypothetical protein